MVILELISVTKLLLLRHLESDRGPPFLTGYVIHIQNPGFLGDRGGTLFTPEISGFWTGGTLLRGGSYSQLGGHVSTIIKSKNVVLSIGYNRSAY